MTKNLVNLSIEERLAKIKELFELLYSEFKGRGLYIEIRSIYTNRAVSKYISIDDLDNKKDWKYLKEKLEEQATKGKPHPISILYNPVKKGNRVPEFVKYLVFDIDDELSDDKISKLKEFKPFIIIKSGHGYHVIFKLSTEINVEDATDYSGKFAKVLKNTIGIEKIEHFSPNSVFRLPYTLNLKDNKPILSYIVEINKDNILTLEEIDKFIKEYEEVSINEKISQKIEKYEDFFFNVGVLDKKELKDSLKKKIINIIEKADLIKPGFVNDPLFLISSLLIKAGYKFDQIRDFIGELANTFRGKDPPEYHVKTTIDYLISEINSLKEHDINDIKHMIKDKIESMIKNKETSLFIDEQTKNALFSEIEKVDEKDKLIYLYVKYAFPGKTYIKNLYTLGKINDEQYKSLIKLYSIVYRSTSLLRHSKILISERKNYKKYISYSYGHIYLLTKRYTKDGVVIEREYIHNDHYRFYILDAKEIKVKNERKIIIKVKILNEQTGTYEIIEDAVQNVAEQIGDKYLLHPNYKDYVGYLFRESNFKVEKAYDQIGLSYDLSKRRFVPTYFGYEKYKNVKYSFNPQQIDFLNKVYSDIEEELKKLRNKRSNKIIYKTLKLLDEFYNIIKYEDPYYYYNTLMVHGYMIGSTIINAIKRYFELVTPNLILFDNGIGGTGKSTSLKILAKVLFDLNIRESAEELMTSPRLRVLSSLFSIPIIIDDIKEELIIKNETLFKQFSSGAVQMQRLHGSESAESFTISTSYIFSINADIRERFTDLATSDRFILLEYKTRYVGIEDIEISIARQKIHEIYGTILSGKYTIAHILFDEICKILNKKYNTSIKINRRLTKYASKLYLYINNERHARAYAVILFGLEIWNKLMKKLNYPNLIFNLEDLVNELKNRFMRDTEVTIDEKFANIFRAISNLIVYKRPFATINITEKTAEEINELLEEHKYENPTIENEKYRGTYYLIDSKLLAYAFAQEKEISKKSIASLKEEIYNKLFVYDLATKSDVIYKPSKNWITINSDNEHSNEYKYVKSPLLIRYDVFKRFLDSDKAKLPGLKIPVHLITIEKVINDRCEECGKPLNKDKTDYLVIDKPYHYECLIANSDKIINKIKSEYGLNDKSEDEVIKFIKIKTNEVLQSLISKSKQSKESKPEQSSKKEQSQPNKQPEVQQNINKSEESKEESSISKEEREEKGRAQKEEKEENEKSEEYASLEEILPGLKEEPFEPEEANKENKNSKQ